MYEKDAHLLSLSLSLSLVISLFFLSSFVFIGIAHAAPLYTPGQTLDPNCLPSNPDCTVSPASSTSTFSGTVKATDVISQGPIIDVRSFGAKGDGSTDDTAAIQAAINSAGVGSTVYFPCQNATFYKITSTLDLTNKSRITLRGTSNECQIEYVGATSQTAAFDLVGADTITFQDINLFSTNYGFIPKVALLLGRPNANAGSAHHNFLDFNVEGYASQALVYSIASEENTWNTVQFILNGGGAKYVYYTSTGDDLGIASLPTSSNLSNWFSNFHFNDFSTTDSTHSVIYIGGIQGGDSVFRDGYLYAGSSTAVTVAASGPNFINDTFENLRAEGVSQFFYLNAPGNTINNLRITNNTLGTPVANAYFVNSSPSTIISGATIEGNSVASISGNTSVFPIVQDSTISEAYPFTTVSVSNSSIQDRSNGTFTLSSNSAPALVVNGGSVFNNLTAGSSSQLSIDSAGNLESTGLLNTPWAGMGIYQNLLKNSQFDTSDGGWGGYCGTGGAFPNTSDIAAPDGSFTAQKFVLPSVIGCTGNSLGQQNDTVLISGQTYTASVWLKGAHGGESIRLGLNDTHNEGITLTSQWKRYTYTVKNITDTSHGFEYFGNTPNGVFYVWGAQLEQASSAGVYVHTTNSPVGANSGLVVNSNSFLNGNVGIGTSTPSARLTITGSSTDATNALLVTNSNGTRLFNVTNDGNLAVNKGTGFFLGGDGNTQLRVDDTPSWLPNSNNVMTLESYAGPFVFRNTANSTNVMTIGPTGNLTIGTSATTTASAGGAIIHVNGAGSHYFDLYDDGQFNIRGDGSSFFNIDNFAAVAINALTSYPGGTDTYHDFHQYGGSQTQWFNNATNQKVAQIGDNAGDAWFLGNVGIGTTTSSALLTLANNNSSISAPLVSFLDSSGSTTLEIRSTPTTYGAVNTAIGVNAGKALAPIQYNSMTYGQEIGGNANTFYGWNAGTNLIDGNENTLIGHQAGLNLIGADGGDPNFVGSLNTAIGSDAALALTTGTSNVFLGQKAGSGLTTGSQNVFIGKSTGSSVTTESGNIFIGALAGKFATGRFNTYLGSNAGLNAAGEYNIFIGTDSGADDTYQTGVANRTFIAGADNSSESINDVYFGKGMLSASPTAYTIHGTDGLGSNITGADLQLAAGKGTGDGLSGAISFFTSHEVISGTQQHYLAEAMRIASNSNVGIGTTTPATALDVAGYITTESVKNCDSSSQAIGTDATGKLVCDTSLSDQRLKNDITSLDANSSLALVNSLNAVSFYWKDPSIPGTGSTQQQFGFIAQQVQQVAPNLVAKTDPTYLTPDGTYYLNYQGVIPLLAKAIQAQQSEIISLQSATSTISNLASSTSFISAVATAVQTLLQTAGNWTMNQITAVTGVFTHLSSTDITSTSVSTQQLCVGTTCVTEDQLKQLLQKENVTAAVVSIPVAPTITATTTTIVMPVSSSTDQTVVATSTIATTTVTTSNTGASDVVASTTATVSTTPLVTPDTASSSISVTPPPVTPPSSVTPDPTPAPVISTPAPVVDSNASTTGQ